MTTTDWKHILTTTKCCVKIETFKQLQQLASLTGFKNHRPDWLIQFRPLMVYSEGSSKITASYSSFRYAKDSKYTIYEFSDVFLPQPKQEPSMSKYMTKYKVGDTFKNSKGTICTIIDITDFDTYKYKSLGSTYNTTTHNIDKYWTKVDISTKPTYKIGDKVLIRLDLKANTYYSMHHDSSTVDSISSSMCKLAAGKVVTIKEKHEYSGTFKWRVLENDYFWTDEMFAGLATDDLTVAETILSSTPVAAATIALANPKPTTKEKPMAKTLKDNINTQITEVKGAAVNAAELKAGQLINKQAIKLIKPQLPMMVRGFADHPAASVVLANVIGLALKQYAPENPKLAKVSNLMLNAAAFDTIDSFNIDEMVDKLLTGIKLPAGISLDDE